MAKNKLKQKEALESSGLEQLFGSKTRFGLLRLFCKEPEREFFVRELSRQIGGQLNAVRREIENLMGLEIISDADGEDPKKRFYKLNTNFVLISELSSLITRSELLAEKKLVDRIKALGSVELCLLTGSLVGTNAPCDIFIVGRLKKETLSSIVGRAEKEMGKPIAYTLFTPEEYRQRKSLADKFIYGILEAKKVVAVDKNGECSEEPM